MTPELMVAIGLALMNGILVPLIAWPIKEQRRQLAELREELKEQRTRHDQVVATIPRDFVLKEDFTRIMVNIDRKLDVLGAEIGKLARGLLAHVEEDAS